MYRRVLGHEDRSTVLGRVQLVGWLIEKGAG